MFQKATKTKARLRFAVSGPSGSGKTYSALAIAQHLGKTVAMIDTEHGSASKYADQFDFDVCELSDFHPARYMDAIREAGRAEYDVIVIDSLSHAWFWELNETGKAQNSFTAWGKVRPLERALIDAMLSSPAHILVTMRAKTEWVLVDSPKSGKPMPEKIGTAPIQASGIEYEFDIAGELNLDHLLNISKSRCSFLANTQHLNPGEELAKRMLHWLEDGSPMPESGQSKCDRVKAAREALEIDGDSVKTLIVATFDRTSPAQLTSEQVDELISMIQAMSKTA